ncbi:MAG: MBL fold metallo-hydrolase [Balneolaceae bacterium]
MLIDTFTVGPFAENTYLVTIQDKSLLIDPGFSSTSEFQMFKKKLGERDSGLIAVMLTHAHVDHVLGLSQILNSFDCPVYLNHSDLYLWKNYSQQSAMFGIQTGGFNFIPEPLDEQKNFKIGPFVWDVFYTPGHSPDHVSLYNRENSLLIAGDALFRESIGRTDLYKGDFDLLAKSIREKLYTLPDETTVYPGHGPATTIGHEKKYNPFIPDSFR